MTTQTFRTDWSGLRDRLDAAFATVEKQITYEMRSAHLDELARVFEDGIAAAIHRPSPMSDQANTTVSDDTGAVAWLHPTAGWVHHDRQQVAMHCRKDGPGPAPLYARRATADVMEAADGYLTATAHVTGVERERCVLIKALAALNPPMGSNE